MAVGPIRGVLFDWGHTLFDTASSAERIVAYSETTDRPMTYERAWELWEAARVASRAPEEIAKGRDRGPAEHRQCWLDLWAGLEAECPGVGDVLYEHETSAAGWSPFIDARSTLESLKRQGIKIAVVSDVAFDLRPILAHYDLAQFVDSWVLSYERGSIKPDGLLFGIACDELGIAPSEALMVGDNHNNDGAGVTAGLRVYLMPHVESGTERGLNAVLCLVGG
jgi:HAD superfamily hydrolase (TIGR01509 family)